MKRLLRILGWVLFAVIMCGSASAQSPSRGVALVIGNGAYETSPLENPPNDAADMSSVLRRLGFDVTTLIDVTAMEMDSAIYEFGRELSRNRDSVGVFYYAGHGMQVNGRNYLIPIGSNINAEDEVRFKSIDAAQVLAKMESAVNRVNIVMMDACRDNPFARSFRTSDRGLAVVEAPRGSLIIYATSPGNVAADGSGRNGVFTGALLKHIMTPDVDVEIMLKSVRADVMAETNNAQTPWSTSSLSESFYFTGFIAQERSGTEGGTARDESPAEASEKRADETISSSTASTSVTPASIRPAFQVERGNVRITTIAPATIEVDGREVARFDRAEERTIEDVEVGRRTFVATYGDGHTETKTVMVSATMAVELDFSYGLGSIRVVATTDGTVLLDGIELGMLATGQSATVSDVGSGSHTVELRYANGLSETKRVTVAPNETVEAQFVGLGSVRVAAATAGSVIIDGTRIGEIEAGGEATFEGIAVGRRNVVVRYSSEASESNQVTVDANATVRVAFEGIGSVRVNATTDGTIYIDGTRKGSVTAGSSETIEGIGVGTKSVEVRYSDGERETNTISVRANGVAAATFSYVPRPDYGSRAIRDEILVEAGTFSMGTPSGGDDDERPVHRVTLDSFFMMKTEVTFSDYVAFARATGRELPNDRGWGRGDRPVIYVNWYDAIAYANWLSERDDLDPAYRISGTDVTWNRTANGWRLPTEAEWEYAARGGQSARETTYAGSNSAGSVAWYSSNPGSKTRPVAGKQPNELGLYDMSGNVWEWCWDWYDSDYYANSPSDNPIGPGSGTYRVLRGGCWYCYASYTRVANRDRDSPSTRYYNGGFRLVRLSSPSR